MSGKAFARAVQFTSLLILLTFTLGLWRGCAELR
jgi:hypothetical protein